MIIMRSEYDDDYYEIGGWWWWWLWDQRRRMIIMRSKEDYDYVMLSICPQWLVLQLWLVAWPMYLCIYWPSVFSTLSTVHCPAWLGVMTLGAAETCQHTQQIRGRVLHCFVKATSCPLEDVCSLETLGTEFTVAHSRRCKSPCLRQRGYWCVYKCLLWQPPPGAGAVDD